MHDLTLVGVHDDGEHLLLAGSEGQRYLLAVDEPLRAAVRRDRARLAQLQIEQTSTLRPRDIQAKIRSGRTAEEVADEAGVAVEHVRRYEGPVLAEREFVARQARGVRLRRATPGTPGSYPTLDELVSTRLAAREVDTGSASWDAWRTDGTWFVRLTFEAAGRERRAEWEYDVQLRHVTALDDEARWLVDEPAPERADPIGGRRVLAPVRADGVRERVYDVEADGGVRAAEDDRASAAAATVDLLDTLRERRGRRQWVPDASEDPDGVDPLELAVDQLRVRAEALGEPPAAHPPRSRPEELEDAELVALPEAPPASKVPTTSAGASSSHKPASPKPSPHAQAAKPGPKPTAKPGGQTSHRSSTDPLDLDAAAEQDRSSASRRSRRASVPSWDDIVFGSRRD
ncbi:MAG TPA: septation protein SepH [Kineosporiaceae bacterium]|nr:septation protein SepH [Kineosporiaceae bacterium]